MTGFIDRTENFMSASILNMTKPRCVYLENVLNFWTVLLKFMKVSIGLRTDILLVCLPRPMNR